MANSSPATAPQVPPGRDSFAAAVERRAARDQALATLSEFKFNDQRPFDGGGIELARTVMEEEHALTIVLSTALEETTDQNGDKPFRDVHVARCIDAIGSLIAFSRFATERSA